MFAIKAKIYKVLYNHSSFIAVDETSSYWSEQKASNFLAFHWSPYGSLVSSGHFVTTRVVLVTSTVVHLPKRTETSLITEADLITKLEQAVQSCNSWFGFYSYFLIFKIADNVFMLFTASFSGTMIICTSTVLLIADKIRLDRMM